MTPEASSIFLDVADNVLNVYADDAFDRFENDLALIAEYVVANNLTPIATLDVNSWSHFTGGADQRYPHRIPMDRPEYQNLQLWFSWVLD